MSPTSSDELTTLAALLGGNAPKPVIGRKVVSLNTNGKYAVDRSRPVFLNKKTRKKMRPVVKLDRNGNVKYRTAINLVDAIPATQKAALRARRAARKRSSAKTKRSSPKTKRSSAKRSSAKTKRSSAKRSSAKRSSAKTKTKRSSAKRSSPKTKTSATKTSKRSKRSKRKASAAATNKATTQQPRRNPFARFLTLDKNNPAVRTLKNTFDAMESRRVSIVKRKKKK